MVSPRGMLAASMGVSVRVQWPVTSGSAPHVVSDEPGQPASEDDERARSNQPQHVAG